MKKAETDKKSHSSSSEDEQDSEFESEQDAEDFADYRVDGYHPVVLGEIFNNKYVVVQKLGWGHFSTVWLVNELKTNNYFALKIQKSKKSYAEAALDELEILKALANGVENEEWHKTILSHMEKYKINLTKYDIFNIGLVDNFVHYGMHGKHYCSVFDIMGPTLLDLIQFFEDQDRGMDIPLVKIITKQLLLGLDYMHRVCGVIHTDLKPENIMIELPKEELKGFIEDLKNYKKKPLSMKFLKKLQETGGKNKKKNQRKKLKRQQKKEAEIQQASSTDQQKLIEEVDANPKEIMKEHTSGADEMVFFLDSPDETTKDSKSDISSLHLSNPQGYENSNMDSGLDKSTEMVITREDQGYGNSNSHTRGFKMINEDEEGETEELKQKKERNNDEIEEEERKGEGEEEDKDKKSPQKSMSEDNIIFRNDKSKDQEKDKCPSYVLKWKGHINVKIDETIKIKIVDFGNACWTNKHFTDNIQTREYRSLEAILGLPYKPNTDIWSLACVVYELLTSSFLFKPHKGETYSKDDDHLALMIEHLGKIPKALILKSKDGRQFFNKNGQLMKIKELQETSISSALIDAGGFQEKEAKEIEEFLLPMLEYDTDKRIDAQKALESKWLWSKDM